MCDARAAPHAIRHGLLTVARMRRTVVGLARWRSLVIPPVIGPAHYQVLMRRVARSSIAFCAVVLASSAGAPAPGAITEPDAAYTVAFKSFAPNNADIFIADADGGHAKPLAPDAALDYNASFSPDGQWI